MKKLQLLLVALALVSFTAFYSCGNVKEKVEEAAIEAVEEVEEAVVEEAVVEETEEAVAEEAEVEEVEETEEAPEE